MAQIPVAVQMFTVRDEAQKDFIGTLRKIAKIGYAGVELAGYGNLGVKELKSVLDDLGLRVAGSHVGIEALESNLSQIIDDQQALGSKYVTFPWIPEVRRQNAAGFKQVAEVANNIGANCVKQGINLCFHNHNVEFVKFDGEYGLDILYANSDPKNLQAELDLYWIAKAGEDPAAYIRKYAGRAPLLHLKDMAADGDFAEVGEGTLDWDAIFAAVPKASTDWYIVEQDVCKRPCLESVEISFRNLQARGIA